MRIFVVHAARAIAAGLALLGLAVALQGCSKPPAPPQRQATVELVEIDGPRVPAGEQSLTDLLRNGYECYVSLPPSAEKKHGQAAGQRGQDRVQWCREVRKQRDERLYGLILYALLGGIIGGLLPIPASPRPG